MSQVLTVPTHFNDLGDLSEGFLDRVEQDTLILYGPVAYEDGSEIEFAVLLADGSPALEGTGRVRAAVDGGADRVPETRYDVVVEALQMDGRSEVVFERLVLARQAVSEHPSAEDAEPPTGDVDVVRADDEPTVDEAPPYIDDIELAADEVFSVPPDEAQSIAPEEDEPVTVPPDEDAPDTVPPEASDEEGQDEEEDAYEDEPATVIAAVDAEAMMAEAEAASEPVLESVPVSASEPVLESDADDLVVDASISEASVWDAEAGAELSEDAQSALEANADQEGGFDSEYAFEHGIAEEPQVGMPVPIPSMAAPPEAPPAPPTLRLAEPPEGLTRPSLAQAEESPFTADGEVSDVHTTGLFVYDRRAPDTILEAAASGPQRLLESPAAVEAADGYDVEDSEPPASR